MKERRRYEKEGIEVNEDGEKNDVRRHVDMRKMTKEHACKLRRMKDEG